ncbi:MAG: glycerol-3-phosphate 1-O-acyltransferase PlsY [Phycisphaerae bacterium]|jgi:glycerol-3-phosphate acyltransferase PlsY|nr:glycerol-3-phosphate 1-O-acyltransferase PlsY [Phycisphaerae bacterium]
MAWPLLLILSFVCGSVPFGLLIARAKGIDIRTHGSGNIGATNVGRVLGRRWGFLCFLLDAIKGATPVLIAGAARGILGVPSATLDAGELWLWLLCGVLALLGHVFSPWVRFKGGKGVATGFGAFVAMWTPLTLPTLIALVVWAIGVKVTKMVSLASMIAAFSIPVAILARCGLAAEPAVATRAEIPTLVISGLIAILIVVKHRANIGRILRGEELKVKA